VNRPVVRLTVGLAVAIAVVAILGYIPQHYGPTDTYRLSNAFYIAIAAMGLNVLTGYNGQVSIGHGAFFGLGAYTTAILMHQHGWSFLATIPIVIVVALVVGAAVGFPALRVKGLYLALVTLGLAVLFPDLTTRFVPNELCRSCGTNLVTLRQTEIAAPSWVPARASAPDQWVYYLALVFAVVLLAVVFVLSHSRFGRALIAVRDHEAAATMVGINLPAVKVGAFALSAAYAAIAGSLAVLVNFGASADKVSTFQLSIEFLVAVVVGGTATVVGPAIGGFFVVYVQYWITQQFPGEPLLSPAIFGVILILLMYVLPDGAVGAARRSRGFVMRRWQRRSPSSPTPATT
jgi:branched-chain amino acid transport system permease protein